jgi:hypothetical protein
MNVTFTEDRKSGVAIIRCCELTVKAKVDA